MAKNNSLNKSDIIFYKAPKGNVNIEVVYNNECFWLSQKRLAELFGVKVPAINKHLKHPRLYKDTQGNAHK